MHILESVEDFFAVRKVDNIRNITYFDVADSFRKFYFYERYLVLDGKSDKPLFYAFNPKAADSPKTKYERIDKELISHRGGGRSFSKTLLVSKIKLKEETLYRIKQDFKKQDISLFLRYLDIVTGEDSVNHRNFSEGSCIISQLLNGNSYNRFDEYPTGVTIVCDYKTYHSLCKNLDNCTYLAQEDRVRYIILDMEERPFFYTINQYFKNEEKAIGIIREEQEEIREEEAFNAINIAVYRRELILCTLPRFGFSIERNYINP